MNTLNPAPPADLQTLQVARSYKGQQAVGQAVLKPPLTRAAIRARHEKLAVARAWLSLAEQSGQKGDWPGVVECAQNGHRELGELGELGARFGVMDHSDVHWMDARLEAKQGQFKKAAPVMLQVLKVQTSFYVRYYSQEVAE